jgi:hypothetical protein
MQGEVTWQLGRITQKPNGHWCLRRLTDVWHWCCWRLVGAVHKHPTSMWFSTKEVIG